MTVRAPADRLKPRQTPGGEDRRAELWQGAGGWEEGASLAEATEKAADAVARLLDAVLPADERSCELEGTPRRVAESWLKDLLDGYREAPGAVLAESIPSAGQDLVAVTGIDFHSMCPHHLLPSRGVAHVAYVPGGKVVGFGQIARLVDCFAHRLVLQEVLSRQVAEALVIHLGARGAACALDAEQTCLTVRGERRREARAHAQCFLGAFEADPLLQARFWSLIDGHARAERPTPRGADRRRAGGEAGAVRAGGRSVSKVRRGKG
ncbi:MAG TPA: GTP cyclohydrolase I [Anaeromyxobacteraceae bacterium]|nr:GTP cyclohydrolase I [Anaeromyxobacteraceae bacterium]